MNQENNNLLKTPRTLEEFMVIFRTEYSNKETRDLFNRVCENCKSLVRCEDVFEASLSTCCNKPTHPNYLTKGDLND